VTGARRIDDFRGDFEQIAAMMEEAWAVSTSPPLLYTPTFLKSSFEYPGAAFSLAPTLYDGDQPLAFVAGFPRTIAYSGEQYTVLLITFLTAAAEHRNAGYGIVIWNELVRRAREAGFDGMVNYCIEGDAMNRMIVPAARRMKVPVQRVYSVEYLSRVLWPKRDTPEPVTPPLDRFLERAAEIAEDTPLARIWTEAEARWQCTREGAISVEAGNGLLTGYIMQTADARRTKSLLVEDVLWGSLADDERAALVVALTTRAAAAGARVAAVPSLGYADLRAFEAAGFRPSQRVVHMYLSLWGAAPAVEPLSSCYLDVV
jgi:hypothetical protein